MRALILGLLIFEIHFSQAAVILSNCPVAATNSSEPSAVDRFKPDRWRGRLQNYSRRLPHFVRWISWMYTSEMSDDEKADKLREAGRWLEDFEFVQMLSTDQACHGSNNPMTEPLAIFPFVMKVQDGSNPTKYRLRYKACEYYVDQKRQLPIENACTVIGRENGYTFEELTQRFERLQVHVQDTREALQMATVFGGLLATFASFGVLRVAKIGLPAAAAVAAVPTAAAYLAITQGYTDDLIRDMIDFKDAAEVALTGDLTSNVVVSQPIQDFIPYFVRYLEALEPAPAPASASATESSPEFAPAVSAVRNLKQ